MTGNGKRNGKPVKIVRRAEAHGALCGATNRQGTVCR
jgi:hypothetical protein